MSQKFPAARNPSSGDDASGEFGENRSRQFPQYASQHPVSGVATSSQPASANTSFRSFTSEASTVSSATSPEHRPRSLHVSTILNPSPQRGSPRRRSLAHLTSPRSVSGSIGRTGPIRSPPVELADYRGGTLPRRLPSALSGTILPGTIPSAARARHRASISGIISAQDNPFPYPAQRRDALSPFHPDNQLPTLVPISTPGPPPPRPHPPPAAPPPPPPPPAQSGFALPPVSSGLSYSPGYSLNTPHSSTNNSPSSTYSSYCTQPPGQSSLSTTPTFIHAGFPSMPGTPVGNVQHGGNPFGLAGPSQSAHGTFPMMSLNTAHGTMQIPVDTTAASKIADEKRKRNAGASARFRQRRKEREREMSIRIAELEQRLKKAEEERDFYRNIIMQAQQRGGQLSQLSPTLLPITHAEPTSAPIFAHLDRNYIEQDQDESAEQTPVSGSMGSMHSENRSTYDEHRRSVSSQGGHIYHAPERHD